MADWDVFHSDRLEVERGLSTAGVREALASGALRDDDLIRPAATTVPWARICDRPDLLKPETPTSEPSADDETEFAIVDDDFEDLAPPEFPDDDDEDEVLRTEEGSDSRVALPVVAARDWDEPGDDHPSDSDDPLDEDEDAAAFTLSRGGPAKVEELDLAAMVDVAFQLVLFFLVTATTVLYKSLEVPKPNPEAPAPAAAQQGHSRTLNDLKDAYIIVEIDPDGAMKIDREPVAADLSALVERLRVAREKTGRKTMLLTADYQTQHRRAVLAYDAANEIGLGIAIARPAPPKPPKAS